MQEIIQTMRQQMEESIAHLRHEMGKLRSGRASLNLLDDVRVDQYGQQTPLSHVATLNIPEPRLITIQPWDAAIIPEIEKAIQKAQLGLSPANDGKMIRLPIPALTEERRKDLVKVVHRAGEDSRVSVRNARRDANEAVKKAEKSEGYSEDDAKRTKQDVQKITDEFISTIDEAVTHKEAEVMTV